MKKLGRLLLWLLAAAVVFAFVLLLAVNLYVQSQGTHHRIQQELSQRLNTPLHLSRISVTPWSGLKLNGITIPQESGKMGGNFLQAESFQLRVQFWSLFSERLVIRQVALIKPQVVWAQNSSGKWRLPELPPARARKPSSVVNRRFAFSASFGWITRPPPIVPSASGETTSAESPHQP